MQIIIKNIIKLIMGWLVQYSNCYKVFFFFSKKQDAYSTIKYQKYNRELFRIDITNQSVVRPKMEQRRIFPLRAPIYYKGCEKLVNGGGPGPSVVVFHGGGIYPLDFYRLMMVLMKK